MFIFLCAYLWKIYAYLQEWGDIIRKKFGGGAPLQFFSGELYFSYILMSKGGGT